MAAIPLEGTPDNPYWEFPFDRIVDFSFGKPYAVLTVTSVSETSTLPGQDVEIPTSKQGFDVGEVVPYDTSPDGWKTRIDPQTGKPASPGIDSAQVTFNSPNTNIDPVGSPHPPKPDPNQTNVRYLGTISPGQVDNGTVTFDYPYDGTDFMAGIRRDYQSASDAINKAAGQIAGAHPGGTTNYPAGSIDPISGSDRGGLTEVVSGASWDSDPPTDGIIHFGNFTVTGASCVGTLAWPPHLFIEGFPALGQPGPVVVSIWASWTFLGGVASHPGSGPPPMCTQWNGFADSTPVSWSGVRIESYPTPDNSKTGQGYSQRQVYLFNFGQMDKDLKGKPSAGPNNDPTLVTVYNEAAPADPNSPDGNVGYANQYRLQLYHNPKFVCGPQFTVVGDNGNAAFYDVTKTVEWDSTPPGVLTQILQFNKDGWVAKPVPIAA